MSIKLNKTEATKNIINALDAMKADQNINLGIEEIEFPDGSKEKFYHTDASDYDHVESQWYDEVCKLTLSPKQCGTIGNKGFVSSSGYGDGSYECYIAKNNNDEIIAIRIDFIEK